MVAVHSDESLTGAAIARLLEKVWTRMQRWIGGNVVVLEEGEGKKLRGLAVLRGSVRIEL